MNIKGAPVLWQEGKYAVINNYRNQEKPFQLMKHIRRNFGDGTAMLSWEVVDHFETLDKAKKTIFKTKEETNNKINELVRDEQERE